MEPSQATLHGASVAQMSHSKRAPECEHVHLSCQLISFLACCLFREKAEHNIYFTTILFLFYVLFSLTQVAR